MSDSIKWLLWILGLILLLWMGVSWDSCRGRGWETFPSLCPTCEEEAAISADDSAVVPPATVETRLPIDFSRDNPTAFTNPGYEDDRERILEGYKEGQILEITGNYYEGEAAPEGFENMGIARAASIRDLLAPDIPAEKVLLKANLLTDDNTEEYFLGHSSQWVSEQAKSVEVIDDCTTIRFATNSADGIIDEAILTRLDEIAARVRKTGEKIMITGHTDNEGEADGNLKLGTKRALDIRREFINRRVLREQISTTTRGESEPIASNDSERGRAENRRVEVCLSE